MASGSENSEVQSTPPSMSMWMVLKGLKSRWPNVKQVSTDQLQHMIDNQQNVAILVSFFFQQ